MPKPLIFKVAPHIVQDLGLNLYTSLPRALVEFVANAYDADSPFAEIEMDFKAIHNAREAMRKAWEKEQEKKPKDVKDVKDAPVTDALGERTLPDNFEIVVRDHGIGMSRDELQDKFLVAGRRRRDEEPQKGHSDGGRVVMGRKGLGKLAGFGIARKLVIISRKRAKLTRPRSLSISSSLSRKLTRTKSRFRTRPWLTVAASNRAAPSSFCRDSSTSR